jgi:deoxyadenosine/deoxycytidine kinase
MKEKKFHKIFVFSGTEEVNNFYKKFIDSKCIYNKISVKWFETLINKMIELSMNNEKLPNILIIFDDFGGDKFLESQMLENIFTKGRHINISVVVILQYLKSVPPIIRCNTSFIICGQVNYASVKIIAEDFLNGCISRKEFYKMYTENTSNHNFLIINNNSVKNPNDINEIYSTIKAEIKK